MERKIKFKLQNLVLRSDRLPDEHFAMMYRGARLKYDPFRSSFLLHPGEAAEFFTYFNSITCAKWRKYTAADRIFLQLKAKGDFKVQLFAHYREGSEIRKEFYPMQEYHFARMQEVEIDIPENSKGAVAGFEIIALGEFAMEGGGWYTEVFPSQIRDVRISIATTTFKKEAYIRRNIDILERELFYGEEPCREHFRLLIVDNGRTLDPEEINSGYITVFPNINAGGAGGFTRGIIESLHSAQDPTHILLMDDDVTILPESMVRTYALLALIRKEYEDYFISGAMLRSQQMNEQHEDVGYVCDEGYYKACKPTMFLHLWDQVFLNDEERPAMPNSYAAWWYCCFPVTQIHPDDLPLPVFIRCDDVDFSIRHKAKIITLNGIFVWHDDFAYKFNASMEFYMVIRNSLATQAIDGIYPDADFKGHINTLFEERLKALNYQDCDLLLDAIEDYLKGPEFLMEPRGEQIVKEKSAKNEKLADMELIYPQVKDVRPDQVYRDLYAPAPLEGFKKWIYDRTYNFHLFPKCLLNKETGIIPYDWFYAPGKNYKRDRLLAVNFRTKTAHVRVRSRRRCLDLLKRRKRLYRRWRQEGKMISERYRQAAGLFRSEKFWREYLGI